MSRIMPAMSDTRMFTDYTSSGQREANLKAAYGIVGDENAYREFLQANALRVAKEINTVNTSIVRDPQPTLPASHVPGYP